MGKNGKLLRIFPKTQGDILGTNIANIFIELAQAQKRNGTQELEDQEIQGICPITSKVAESYRQRGKHPYLMPLGGATPLGNLGYINAVDELMYQMDEQGIHADYLIAGTGTGGTQAGIECGLRLANASAKMLGISVSHHTQLLKPT